jgi:hypothetical protein
VSISRGSAQEIGGEHGEYRCTVVKCTVPDGCSLRLAQGMTDRFYTTNQIRQTK